MPSIPPDTTGRRASMAAVCLRRAARVLLAPLACALLSAAPLPGAAQVQPGQGPARNFPESALGGTLVLGSSAQATINGLPVRLAPGMRLLGPQNTLVPLHTVLGQSLRVNYVFEASTGMLLTAWVLTGREAAQARRQGPSTSNINTGAGTAYR